jgi:phage gp36-like protein
MAYATIADLQARFGQAEVEQLSDREQPGQGWAVDAVAQRALDDAAGLIDARLGARFAVPVASPSTELVRVACDVARYLMHDLAPHLSPCAITTRTPSSGWTRSPAGRCP